MLKYFASGHYTVVHFSNDFQGNYFGLKNGLEWSALRILISVQNLYANVIVRYESGAAAPGNFRSLSVQVGVRVLLAGYG